MIIQRNADFGPYTRAADDGSKIESMTVERKITSRHGVDSRPLSEWLRVPGASPGGAQRVLPDWDFGSMEVNALFVNGKTIKPGARAFTAFLLKELRAAYDGPGQA